MKNTLVLTNIVTIGIIFFLVGFANNWNTHMMKYTSNMAEKSFFTGCMKAKEVPHQKTCAFDGPCRENAEFCKKEAADYADPIKRLLLGN